MNYVRDRANDRAVETNLLVQLAKITHDPRSALEAVVAGSNVTVDDALDNPFLLVGSKSFIGDQLIRLTELRVDDLTVFEISVDALIEAKAG